MAFAEIKGSLFDAPEGVVIGHGCNMKGFMGSGIARAFKELYPPMYTYYKDFCSCGAASLGGVCFWQDENGDRRTIANIFSQDEMGPNADFQAIFNGVYRSLRFVGKDGTLAIPRIGCGIGGLDWEKVKPMLQSLAGYWDDRNLHVYWCPIW